MEEGILALRGRTGERREEAQSLLWGQKYPSGAVKAHMLYDFYVGAKAPTPPKETSDTSGDI
jgi:hypothetical protein